MIEPVFRFAPSPNGRLHLGHAYSALLNAEFAERMRGRLFLRIEDLDPVRSRIDLIDAVFDDLSWLGLRFEAPVLRQSQRFDLYRDALRFLAGRGLAYPCFCSRGTVAAAVQAYEDEAGAPWPRDPDGTPIYPGSCRTSAADARARIAAGRPHAWRLDMEAVCRIVPEPRLFETFGLEGIREPVLAEPARWGDVVIGRRDVPGSYHLAVVVDDAAQGVTHVVRGVDLLAATDIHLVLQALLGCRTPRYHHHALIRDNGGDKLSKSRGSQSLADLRAAGWTPSAVRGRLGFA